MQVNLLDWYFELPIITRVYFTGTFLLTALCSLDVLSPFQLYYSWSAIARGELWRLVTNFFYFGNIGIDFLFHMYFVCVARRPLRARGGSALHAAAGLCLTCCRHLLAPRLLRAPFAAAVSACLPALRSVSPFRPRSIRYCRSLEEGSFGHRSADFLWCLLFGMGALMAVAPWCTHIMFYGSSLTFMLVYLWGKRNPGMQISLLGLLAFNAPYLAWVLLGFSLLLGHDVSSDLLGIVRCGD